jgi:hypothetical protein
MPQTATEHDRSRLGEWEMKDHDKTEEQLVDELAAMRIDELGSLRDVEITMGDVTCQEVPEPVGVSRQLLYASGIKLPAVLPLRRVQVATRKKLVSQRHLN